ncbi:CocE/NonD family hydrolase C-terminal non-catalytic domain-containing protein [Streptomyces bobili]|uniref:CocE/NonD family hydrolase C-terminal non-catalytic domain-containing protein n=1 Tax=Streptomyces bobili TaxID=67280 RepID=UPI00364CDF5E
MLNEPGADATARVEMTHTGYRLKRGHRLRLHIAGSDYPEFALNPGTAENPWSAMDRVPSRHTLHTGPILPARLELRILPAAI